MNIHDEQERDPQGTVDRDSVDRIGADSSTTDGLSNLNDSDTTGQDITKKAQTAGPTGTRAEGERKDVDEALERTSEAGAKPGHRIDRAEQLTGEGETATPVVGANAGTAVKDAKEGKKSQAA
jgi:hypothetical protein